jgi:dihydrofolate reductase
MKIAIHEFVSLDGVMQGPGAKTEDESGGFERGGWLVPWSDDPGFGDVVVGWFSGADALLLGRSTYAMMQRYWTKVDADDIVTRTLNHGRKYVVSSTLTDETATWDNSTVVPDGLDGVRRLKEQEGGELQVHGSWQLAHALHNAGLVDEYRLLVFPVVVGDGKRLFDTGGAPSGFTVVDRTLLDNGATAVRMRPEPFRTADLPMPGDGDDAVA